MNLYIYKSWCKIKKAMEKIYCLLMNSKEYSIFIQHKPYITDCKFDINYGYGYVNVMISGKQSYKRKIMIENLIGKFKTIPLKRR